MLLVGRLDEKDDPKHNDSREQLVALLGQHIAERKKSEKSGNRRALEQELYVRPGISSFVHHSDTVLSLTRYLRGR